MPARSGEQELVGEEQRYGKRDNHHADGREPLTRYEEADDGRPERRTQRSSADLEPDGVMRQAVADASGRARHQRGEHGGQARAEQQQPEVSERACHCREQSYTDDGADGRGAQQPIRPHTAGNCTQHEAPHGEARPVCRRPAAGGLDAQLLPPINEGPSSTGFTGTQGTTSVTESARGALGRAA